MKHILDTNAVSALMKGDLNLLARLRRAEKTSVAIPQSVVSEIAYGIARLPTSKRKGVLTERFELVREELSRIPWTDETSDAFGAIKASLE